MVFFLVVVVDVVVGAAVVIFLVVVVVRDAVVIILVVVVVFVLVDFVPAAADAVVFTFVEGRAAVLVVSANPMEKMEAASGSSAVRLFIEDVSDTIGVGNLIPSTRGAVE